MTQTIPPISAEEREQMLQTIEMFEVITQASPTDIQSLEILKDAYLRVGQMPGAIDTAKRLADLFVSAEEYSSAAMEYESILRCEPDNGEIMAALGDIEEKVERARQKAGEAAEVGSIDLDYQAAVAEPSRLVATAQTVRNEGFRPANAAKMEEISKSLVEDGNESLARFLLQHRVATEEVIRGALERVAKKNKDLAPNTMAHSLLDEVIRRGGLDAETVLGTIVDRSKFAYIPLEYYEVDRQIVKMLPESLTLGRLIVPFDVMSRTLMVAMSNPFDALGKEAVQQLLDYNIQWHIASPAAITKVLGDVYRVPGPGVIGAGSSAADATSFKLAAS